MFKKIYSVNYFVLSNTINQSFLLDLHNYTFLKVTDQLGILWCNILPISKYNNDIIMSYLKMHFSKPLNVIILQNKIDHDFLEYS